MDWPNLHIISHFSSFYQPYHLLSRCLAEMAYSLPSSDQVLRVEWGSWDFLAGLLWVWNKIEGSWEAYTQRSLNATSFPPWLLQWLFFSNKGWNMCSEEYIYECVCSVAESCLTLATPWTIGHQAVLSMGFPRQEYGSGLPFPSPRDLPDPGIKPMSPAWQVDSLPLCHLGIPYLYMSTYMYLWVKWYRCF